MSQSDPRKPKNNGSVLVKFSEWENTHSENLILYNSTPPIEMPPLDAPVWMLKSQERVIGPINQNQLVQMIFDGKATTLDEISKPFSRWELIRHNQQVMDHLNYLMNSEQTNSQQQVSNSENTNNQMVNPLQRQPLLSLEALPQIRNNKNWTMTFLSILVIGFSLLFFLRHKIDDYYQTKIADEAAQLYRVGLFNESYKKYSELVKSDLLSKEQSRQFLTLKVQKVQQLESIQSQIGQLLQKNKFENKDVVQIQNVLGLSYSKMQKADLAQEYFNRNLKWPSDQNETYFNLASLALRQKKFIESLEFLKKVDRSDLKPFKEYMSLINQVEGRLKPAFPLSAEASIEVPPYFSWSFLIEQYIMNTQQRVLMPFDAFLEKLADTSLYQLDDISLNPNLDSYILTSEFMESRCHLLETNLEQLLNSFKRKKKPVSQLDLNLLATLCFLPSQNWTEIEVNLERIRALGVSDQEKAKNQLQMLFALAKLRLNKFDEFKNEMTSVTESPSQLYKYLKVQYCLQAKKENCALDAQPEQLALWVDINKKIRSKAQNPNGVSQLLLKYPHYIPLIQLNHLQ